jgi:hypothetical protein
LDQISKAIPKNKVDIESLASQDEILARSETFACEEALSGSRDLAQEMQKRSGVSSP